VHGGSRCKAHAQHRTRQAGETSSRTGVGFPGSATPASGFTTSPRSYHHGAGAAALRRRTRHTGYHTGRIRTTPGAAAGHGAAARFAPSAESGATRPTTGGRCCGPGIWLAGMLD
jgi:hypothetical protein